MDIGGAGPDRDPVAELEAQLREATRVGGWRRIAGTADDTTGWKQLGGTQARDWRGFLLVLSPFPRLALDVRPG